MGSGLLKSCIPRRAFEAALNGQAYTFNAAEPSVDEATFSYVPEGQDDGFAKAPAIVAPGGPVMIDTAVRDNPIDFMFEGPPPPPRE